MKFDLLGRIENMRIPDGKTAILYSVFEAVSNSFHAIEDRFGKADAPEKGRIEIEIQTDGYPGPIQHITVRDNGIGLNEPNLNAFNTCDSRNKSARGGKGIGRLMWLKLFDRIRVESVFDEAPDKEGSIGFNFVADQEDSLQDIQRAAADGAAIGTTITLTGIRDKHNAQMRRSYFLRDLVLHFFPVYMAGAMPRLEVRFASRSVVELRQYLNERIEVPEREVISLADAGIEAELEIQHLYIKRSVSRELRNTVLLVAHDRHVEKQDIERRFALDKLPDKKAYVAIVRGTFLDERVDQERTGFKLTDDQLKAVHKAVLDRSEDFLADHIEAIREEQKAALARHLAEHPKLAIYVPDRDSFVAKLPASLDEDQIGQRLFALLEKDERRAFTDVTKLSRLTASDPEARKLGRAALVDLTAQATGRLADYVVKRHQTLDVIKRFLETGDGAALRDLVFVSGVPEPSARPQEHNLWIVDDRLAYFEFFVSEKPLPPVPGNGVDGGAEDVSAFFLNLLGFRRPGTGDPVILVFFVRPGEGPPRNPIPQALLFAEKLRSHTLRDVQGELISGIEEITAFECYIVCDLNDAMRRSLKRGPARIETADGKGFYGYVPDQKATVRVMTYEKMIKDAERRNDLFMEHLGLPSLTVSG